MMQYQPVHHSYLVDFKIFKIFEISNFWKFHKILKIENPKIGKFGTKFRNPGFSIFKILWNFLEIFEISKFLKFLK